MTSYHAPREKKKKEKKRKKGTKKLTKFGNKKITTTK